MTIEHLDVLIVGAGLSGIGAAVHLGRHCADRRYAVLEGRDAIGGTWDLFRYPGIRSDSDMYTLGYNFKPWTNAKAIADGQSIREYIHETAQEHGVQKHIRLGHRVKRVSWSSTQSRWTVEVERGPQREAATLSCDFLFLCTGYYNYEQGYTPAFPGRDRFQGQIIHPQHWPENLDYSGKRVVVIGSGATAITLVPSMTDKAQHVTMLQRSPTYVIIRPGQDGMANWLNRVLPIKWAYGINRWKNVLLTMLFYNLSRSYPNAMKALLVKGVQLALGRRKDQAKHFQPTYNPWDQRVCVVPDNDLFKAIKQDKASVATDHIDTFTEHGIQLKSGEHLPADIIVTATGLDLLAFGGIEIQVDQRRIDLAQTFSYKGMMLSGVPNLAYAFGYTNASWTLKADLTCEYVCSILNHMRKINAAQCAPQADANVQPEPLLDLTSGYVQRALGKFPSQGDRKPWKLYQNYIKDIFSLKNTPVDDGVLKFAAAAEPARADTPATAEWRQAA